MSRGHKSPRRNQGITRWLKENTERVGPKRSESLSVGRRKSWAVSLDWKRLKTKNRIHGLESPFGLPPQGVVLAQEPSGGSLGQLPPSCTHFLCQGRLWQMPETFSFPIPCRQMLPSEYRPWPSPGLPSQSVRAHPVPSRLCLGGAWVYSGWCWAQDSFGAQVQSKQSRASCFVVFHVAGLCLSPQWHPKDLFWATSEIHQNWGWRQSLQTLAPRRAHIFSAAYWQKMLQLLFTFFQGQQAHYLSRKLM